MSSFTAAIRIPVSKEKKRRKRNKVPGKKSICLL
jgi:hypothetical protein